ncbi:hypothetical protein D3C86_1714080 [compost metagenome]
MLADGAEVGRVPEHLADLYRQVLQHAREQCRVAQHAVLELRQRGKAQVVQRLLQPPPHRGPRVVPEIVLVLAEDGLQQQFQFDLEIGVGQRRLAAIHHRHGRWQ